MLHEDKEAQARYRTLFEMSPVAVYSCDAKGVIQEFNRRAAELWGREPKEGDTDERFCGSFKLYRPDGRFMPHAECPMADVVAGRLAEVRNAEVLIERPDGSRITVIVNILPLKNPQGEISGAINCFYDISERKRIEEAMRESDRNKNEFLAMLAHELRNPLAPILSSLQVLRRVLKAERSGAPGPGVGQVLDVLQRQVGQMVRLIDDLLDAGRISRGKINLRREPVDLSSVVHHAVEDAKPIALSRGQELTVTLPCEPVHLDADPARLAQIAGNLLHNACKFTDRGGRIWLTVERGKGDVLLSVRDNGIGIAADQLEHVFDMFRQGDRSLERSSSGLGIGLTLVKTLTELHGGTVEVKSAGPGQGCEFVVRLPTIQETSAPAPRERPGEEAIAPLRILIVEDNRDSADMLASLLGMSGHDTHKVHNGSAAVEAAAALDPDVVLLDIGLPVLNGYEVARRIREQRGQKRPPILVALTGWGQEEDRKQSKEAGFDAHLVKPVDEDALSRLLAELLPQRAGGQAGSEAPLPEAPDGGPASERRS